MQETELEIIERENKLYISRQIKPIDMEHVHKEFDQLIKIGHQAHTKSSRCKIGNNVVDYFTFLPRLETKGKYNVSYFDFIEQLELFREKKFIQTMLTYYKNVKNKNNTKNQYVLYKEVYNICISAINIMRPLNCMELFSRFQSKRVLNCCAGWGGSTVASAALNLEAHYGIDVNVYLEQPYRDMISFLNTKSTCSLYFNVADAALFDYRTLQYDTVFMSPPYYFIEKYQCNKPYDNLKSVMDTQFYIPMFSNSYLYLQPGGHYIINVCKEIYDNVLVKILGNAHMTFPLKKSKRQNNYTEFVYVWNK